MWTAFCRWGQRAFITALKTSKDLSTYMEESGSRRLTFSLKNVVLIKSMLSLCVDNDISTCSAFWEADLGCGFIGGMCCLQGQFYPCHILSLCVLAKVSIISEFCNYYNGRCHQWPLDSETHDLFKTYPERLFWKVFWAFQSCFAFIPKSGWYERAFYLRACQTPFWLLVVMPVAKLRVAFSIPENDHAPGARGKQIRVTLAPHMSVIIKQVCVHGLSAVGLSK